MSRKNHGRGYGRQNSQDQENWQNRGSMQRNQYDNIGRDQYGSNSRQSSGYGSRDWDRGDDESGRPNWPGEQNSRRYGSPSYGNDSGMGRYQGERSGGYGQNYGSNQQHGSNQGYGDEYGRSRESRGYGNDPDYDNWGSDSESYGGGAQSQRNFEEGRWNRGQDQGDRGYRGQRDSWQGYENESFGGQGGRDRGRGSSGQGGYGQSGSGQGGYGRTGYGQSGSGQYGSGRNQGEHGGRGPKGYRRDDSRIQEDINEELTRHPEIDASEIEVKVSNGEVTLTGTVDNREAKRLAEDCAEGVSGVTEVQNQIRVQKTVGAAREDEDSSSSRSKSGRSGSSSASTMGSSSSESSKNRTGAGIGS